MLASKRLTVFFFGSGLLCGGGAYVTHYIFVGHGGVGACEGFESWSSGTTHRWQCSTVRSSPQLSPGANSVTAGVGDVDERWIYGHDTKSERRLGARACRAFTSSEIVCSSFTMRHGRGIIRVPIRKPSQKGRGDGGRRHPSSNHNFIASGRGGTPIDKPLQTILQPCTATQFHYLTARR